MFTPPTVKVQAKTAVRPSDKSALTRATTDRDREIEREQTSERTRHAGPRFANEESAVVWDFSMIPLDPQGRSDWPDRQSLSSGMPTSVHKVVRMPGEPLDAGVRAEAERRFGHYIGNVRVHCGPEASEAAAAVDAPAFTLGRHIIARDGAPDPATLEGGAILSHELTHVVQQASFDDRELGAARVLEAAHPSEQEARAGTGAATPLARPAIQRAPADILKSGEQLVVDLTESTWRQALKFGRGQTQIVYVLRDTTTGEFLKVGKTTVRKIAKRFGEYVNAGNKWSRKLAVDVWTFRARSGKSAEAFEAELRAGLEKAGARLPWDNTRIAGQPRLRRPGQGIPMPKEQTETQFIDEVEQLRVKHASPNIPKRRGMSSKKRAKLKGAAEQAAAEETAGAEATAQVEQTAADTAAKATPEVEQVAEQASSQVTSKVEQAAADTAVKATPEVEQVAEKTGTQVASKVEQAAADTALKAGAEGTLTRGLGATALEVVFNPALMFGWEVLKGISSDYQQAWDDIRRPARHIGFAQGWAARLAGLDITWIKSNLAPRFVDRTDVATEVLGAAGMAEHSYIVGLGEGFRYGGGYSDAMKAKKLGQAFKKAKARHGEIQFDTENALTRNSLIFVAAMLQDEADRAISRWDDLREKRRKAAEREADFKRRTESWTGRMQ